MNEETTESGEDPMLTNIFALVAVGLLLEAQSEGEPGMRAVASTIYNRAGGQWEKMGEVVLKKAQYECYNQGVDAAFEKYADIRDDKSITVACKIVAEMKTGKFVPTVRATHYCREEKWPYWRKVLPFMSQVGRHVFFYEARKFV